MAVYAAIFILRLHDKKEDEVGLSLLILDNAWVNLQASLVLRDMGLREEDWGVIWDSKGIFLRNLGFMDHVG